MFVSKVILFQEWRTPKLFDELNYRSKGEGVGVHSLVCSTSRVKGRAKAPRWGLGGLTNKSIIDTDLHKPKNKLVSV